MAKQVEGTFSGGAFDGAASLASGESFGTGPKGILSIASAMHGEGSLAPGKRIGSILSDDGSMLASGHCYEVQSAHEADGVLHIHFRYVGTSQDATT